VCGLSNKQVELAARSANVRITKLSEIEWSIGDSPQTFTFEEKDAVGRMGSEEEEFTELECVKLCTGSF